MSFSIKLQNSGFPMNQIEKHPNLVATVTGTLRNETDVVNPIILIERSSFPDCNYMTIDEFHRSYFITEVRSVRNNVWEVHGHSDPLMSFKTQILQNRMLVSRNENQYDLLLNDGYFKCRQNSRIGYISFPSGLHNWNYVLITAGPPRDTPPESSGVNTQEGE